MLNNKERLVKKFINGENKFEEYPRYNKNSKTKKDTKPKKDTIHEDDLNDYKTKYEEVEKDDLLKRIIHLETLNLYQEKTIEKLLAQNENLQLKVEELVNLIDK